MKQAWLIGALVLMAGIAASAVGAEESAYVRNLQFKVHQAGSRITYRGKWVDLTRDQYMLVRALAGAPEGKLSVDAARETIGLSLRAVDIRKMVDQINVQTFNATGAPLVDFDGDEIRLQLHPQPTFVQKNRSFSFEAGREIEFDAVASHVIVALQLDRRAPNRDLQVSSAEFAALGLTPAQVAAVLTSINKKYLELARDPLVKIFYSEFTPGIALYWDGEAMQNANGGIAAARHACERHLRLRTRTLLPRTANQSR